MDRDARTSMPDSELPTPVAAEPGRVLSAALGAALAALLVVLLATLPGHSGALRTALPPASTDAITPLDCDFLLARARAEGWRHLRLPSQRHWNGRPLAVVAWSPTDALVVIAYAPRVECGSLVDARWHDSRFNTGVGSVFRPLGRSATPIDVWVSPSAWEHWTIRVVMGDPANLQRQDGVRGSLRVAIMTAAALLILSALIGAIVSRNAVFRGHALISGILTLWVAELTGVAGYPLRWLLPAEWSAPLSVALLLPIIAYAVRELLVECGAKRRWPHLAAGVRGAYYAALPGALLIASAPPVWLPMLSRAVEAAGALWLLIGLGAALACLRRVPRGALGALAAASPLCLVLASSPFDPQAISGIRAEVTTASATWMCLVLLMLAARRFGNEHDDLSRMSQLAFSDALTGLPNRRGALAYLERQRSPAAAGGQGMVVASLDIDHFKQINDEHGHLRGDQALRLFADALRRARRDTDLVARIGGEEFMVVLPAAELAQMQRVLKTVRSDLQSSETVRQLGFALRFSAGVVRRREGESLTALLEAADQQLYTAKRNGRNRDAIREEESAQPGEEPART